MYPARVLSGIAEHRRLAYSWLANQREYRAGARPRQCQRFLDLLPLMATAQEHGVILDTW